MADRRFTIGYALASKKQASFIRISLINLAKEKGIDLVRIDPEKPLIEQGPFDLVLHKTYGPKWRQNLSEFSEKYPNSLIIDPPDAIERLHNRISMLEAVTESHLTEPCNTITSGLVSFGIPKQTAVYDTQSVGVLDLETEGLKFPVIAKPLVADGSAKSHKMSLVFNNDGLGKLKPPVVLQEFVNHGGVIFKVYVVGEYVKCVKRKSLPDVEEGSLESFECSLSFSQVSNLNSVDKMVSLEEGEGEGEGVEIPPMSFLVDIASKLRRAVGLHLFNFDVIRDTRVGNRYLVIDINYFPGYAKMPGYEPVLTDFFWDVLNKRSNNGKKELGGDGGDVRMLVSNAGCEEDNLPVSPLKRDENESGIEV